MEEGAEMFQPMLQMGFVLLSTAYFYVALIWTYMAQLALRRIPDLSTVVV